LIRCKTYVKKKENEKEEEEKRRGERKRYLGLIEGVVATRDVQ